MALIQVGSFGEFSVVPLEAAMKKLPAARGISDTFFRALAGDKSIAAASL